jgi:cell division protein FtsB
MARQLVKYARRPKLDVIKAAAAPALAVIVICNFAGYAIAGPNGLLALGDYRHSLQQKTAELQTIDGQRAVLQHRVNLLDQRHADPDMADELVRRDLGLARPDEVIIPLDDK